MNERTGIVFSKGNPLTLLGNEVNVGDKAPDFEVIANDMTPLRGSSFLGKVCIIASVPSLDTGTCATETPFAQKRWCAAEGVERVITASDYRDANFGTSYGVLRKESRLLARTIFVVDKEGIVRYIQYVKETSNEPDYEAVLNAVRKLT
jgi:thiol peroxidase